MPAMMFMLLATRCCNSLNSASCIRVARSSRRTSAVSAESNAISTPPTARNPISRAASDILIRWGTPGLSEKNQASADDPASTSIAGAQPQNSAAAISAGKNTR